MIRRLTRGLYDYPRESPHFGLLLPSPDDLAKAIARKSNHVLQLTPAMAANKLGLATQVPAKVIYMTNGPIRTAKIGRLEIQFRHSSPKTLVGAGQITGAVFQALRYVGKDRVDSQVIDKLARALDDKNRKLLAKQSKNRAGMDASRGSADRFARLTMFQFANCALDERGGRSVDRYLNA